MTNLLGQAGTNNATEVSPETKDGKLAKLSPGLRKKIFPEGRAYAAGPGTPVSNYLVHTKRHCNGGKTVDAGLLLRDHCDNGGKIFLTMAGAGSSFQMGITISDLIRAGKIAGISVTGANMEESLYRLVANSHYAYIPEYNKLTREEEAELGRVGFRRITDTFLPEEESVRVVLDPLMVLWREAGALGKRYLWHQFFFLLFERNLVKQDPTANPDDCWLYQAYLHGIPVFVPGWEDSTMGNIFTQACYKGNHRFMSKYKLDKPVSLDVVLPGISYMHNMAEWYMDTTEQTKLAFLQLGGGIAADFPICVVPHLMKDYLADQPLDEQRRLIPPWAAFIEIHSSPMSFGSYSGAGGDEKITWDKVVPESATIQICGDYTEHAPDIAALVLRK
jgi:deoxyhypusine synthase